MFCALGDRFANINEQFLDLGQRHAIVRSNDHISCDRERETAAAARIHSAWRFTLEVGVERGRVCLSSPI